MRLVDPGLQNALHAWRGQSAISERAMADNMWFEERVSPVRQNRFETRIRGADKPGSLYQRHCEYFAECVKISGALPDTFQPDLEPATLTEQQPDEAQPIIRLENLHSALLQTGHSLEELQSARANRQREVIDRFLDDWAAIRDARPVFAAWKFQVPEEVADPDWPHRLRDRLGLAHFVPAGGPVPVALMEYPLSAVLDAARAAQVATAVTAPTVLDTGPWEWFFPAPRDLPYGRAMPLVPAVDENQLLAEMLHVPITYRHDHLVGLGWITRPLAPFNLKDLRNHHLLALRLASRRYDFGEEIPDSVGETQ